MFDEIGVFWDWCLSVADPGIGMASCACRFSFTKCKVKKKHIHTFFYHYVLVAVKVSNQLHAISSLLEHLFSRFVYGEFLCRKGKEKL
jgi:hypothetical protein